MEDEEVRAAWVSVVEAEERIKLMRVLIRRGVGTSEVENALNSSNHLIRQHEDSLHCESSRAKVEQILKTGSEEIHDEDVVVPLLAVPPDVGDAHAALEDLVQLALVQQLRVASLHTLQLHGNLEYESLHQFIHDIKKCLYDQLKARLTSSPLVMLIPR